jgi:hypothetical protein
VKKPARLIFYILLSEPQNSDQDTGGTASSKSQNLHLQECVNAIRWIMLGGIVCVL